VIRLFSIAIACALLAGCEAKPAPTPSKSPAPVVQAAPVPAAPAERRFGAAPTVAGEPVPVATLIADPSLYLGKTVKCEGKVARVCQNKGCWLELQAAEGGAGLRVPMAGHAFFIPQDAVGMRAVVEGELRRSELPAAQRAHYQSEGMQAMGPLALDATSVVLR
jgi:hypothetical protein